MLKSQHQDLSRRERQIMDVVYRLGQATASDVLEGLPDPPSYSAVRALLRILEEKGHLRHDRDGARYLWRATLPRERAQRSALRNILETFFEGSAEKAMAAILDLKGHALDEEELDRLARVIDKARKEGR